MWFSISRSVCGCISGFLLPGFAVDALATQTVGRMLSAAVSFGSVASSRAIVSFGSRVFLGSRAYLVQPHGRIWQALSSSTDRCVVPGIVRLACHKHAIALACRRGGVLAVPYVGTVCASHVRQYCSSRIRAGSTVS